MLSFQDRLKASLGAAQGLAFLHEGCGRRIIYRDFKTSNILVDRVSTAHSRPPVYPEEPLSSGALKESPHI